MLQARRGRRSGLMREIGRDIAANALEHRNFRLRRHESFARHLLVSGNVAFGGGEARPRSDNKPRSTAGRGGTRAKKGKSRPML